MIEDQEQDWLSDEDFIRDFALTGGFERRMTILSRWCEATSQCYSYSEKESRSTQSLVACQFSLLLWNH